MLFGPLSLRTQPRARQHHGLVMHRHAELAGFGIANTFDATIAEPLLLITGGLGSLLLLAKVLSDVGVERHQRADLRQTTEMKLN